MAKKIVLTGGGNRFNSCNESGNGVASVPRQSEKAV